MCWSAGTVKKRSQLEKAARRPWREGGRAAASDHLVRSGEWALQWQRRQWAAAARARRPSVGRASERHFTSSGKAVSTLYPSQSVSPSLSATPAAALA